ncbi:hypothetical protein [Kozakia baliensis]|uniref:hypothetical protein n=1 Tax=Kozakia baliensis TaxID=153496 RepID=UPI0011BEEDE0|nr:hypothetical protein [Kozakia baliensis]
MAVFLLVGFLAHGLRQFLNLGDAIGWHPQVYPFEAQFFRALHVGLLPLSCRGPHVSKNPLNVPIFVFHRMMKTKADQTPEGSDP